MSTRSFIGIVENDNSVRGIYCHFDGYPSHHGPILKQSYTSKDKLNALLSLGDISILDDRLNQVEAYHRDRGEPLNPNLEFASMEACASQVFDRLGVDYAYVFKDNEWYFAKQNCGFKLLLT